MKAMKNIVLSVVTVIVILSQLMSPSLAYADDETPMPSDPPAETITQSLTDVATTESATPDSALETATPMATETSTIIPTELVSPTADPIETDTPPATSTPIPTELATDTVSPEPPTPDEASSTPAPTATDPLPLTPTDSASPTADPIETNTPGETSIPLPTESVTEIIPSESPTPDVSWSTSAPTATDPSPLTPTDLTSPTVDPVETNTPAETSTPQLIESVTEMIPSESLTPDLTSSTPVPTTTHFATLTPTDSTSPTVDPIETIAIPTQVETVGPPFETPAPTELLTEVLPTESLTPDVLSPTATDLASLTVAANTPLPTELETLEPAPDTPEATSTPETTKLPTEIFPTESTTSDVSSSTSDPAETNTPVAAQENTLELTPSTSVLTETDTNITEQPTLLEAAQTISNDASVVVLDSNGQPLPLGSVAAAEAITQSDPVWCPAGQTPTPGANGCTASYVTLADLVANEGGNIAADGTIWITSGPVADANLITIDGLTYTTWSNFAFTLQGGWSGISGDTSIGSNSVFSVPIEMINWNNSIVVNKVSIKNVTNSGSPWIRVQNNSGSITINNSIFTNNSLTNNSVYGASLSAHENITINNSNFNNNDGEISINARNLTIDNSNFNNNIYSASGNINEYFPTSVGYFGALISCQYFLYCAIGNVNISNSSFNGNNSASGFSAYGLTGCYPCEYQYNIMINNSSFNNNSGGAGIVLQTGSGNYTINNSTFNNNLYGAILVGNGRINGSIFSGNHIGAAWQSATGTGTVTLNDLIIDHNAIGLDLRACGFPALNLVLNNVTFNSNATNIDNASNCSVTITSRSVISSQYEGEFSLDCAAVDGYSVNLPNGDLVYIFCPVSGRARISRLENTALPADLPASYRYASAFSLDILQNNQPIPVITEGGYIKASFVAPTVQEGNTYSILYWDNGKWVPLKDFMLDENGKVRVFDLNPGVPEDTRKILSGVRLVTTSGSPRVEVSTNFPGIFVLAQH
jgi:hypothetical protein